ncbi:MAG: endonuclease/exonuclease/phosphatase family protein [Verrucomicrobiota bacterium]
MKIASFNVENLFARARALNLDSWADGREILEAQKKVNSVMQEAVYTDAIKAEITELLLKLEVYIRNDQDAIRRNPSRVPRWALLRSNRGEFDSEPENKSLDMRIVAAGRADWIGWVELVKETVDENATRMTARVIAEIDPDIVGIVEAEDRPALVRFNRDLVGTQFGPIMLVDGNDDRGIDVAVMAKPGYSIESIRSNVDVADGNEKLFSRDCPQYEIVSPNGEVIHVLVNHFKSQSNGGGDKRRKQAAGVRAIVDKLVAEGKHVIVMGDLNEGPTAEGGYAPNLEPLYEDESPLIECYSLPNFDVGPRPGTYTSCGLRDRLDYIFISKSLEPFWVGGYLFRKGLWGNRQTRPTAWETYAEMENGHQQASDHAAVCIELNL